jgi:lysophospholipase L1-like esterase
LKMFARTRKNTLHRLLAAMLLLFASRSHASAQSAPAATATQHPALFLIGDSIVHTGTGTGETGPWGWGAEFIPMFDPAKIHVYNEGLGGRSSRGYIQEAAWAKIVDQLQPGDWVIVQFGHNDAANSQNYPDRTTLKGNGDEVQEIESPVTHQKETIHSYGWYLRQYFADAKAKRRYRHHLFASASQSLAGGQSCTWSRRLRKLGRRRRTLERCTLHRPQHHHRGQI